nr:toll/interleukin-1 receptor domain-containing protein [Duganella guangzhouensis]
MYDTLFISYGGPDEKAAASINSYLASHGVKTWFFPKDSVPGEKLHRTMSEGINSHARVLLLCSQHSLVRPGVLNEIERVLEREAREGGGTILIPVALDDFVYQDWAPKRPDLAIQVRDRVIPKLTRDKAGEIDVTSLDRVLAALNRRIH